MNSNNNYTVNDTNESIMLYSDVFKKYIKNKIGINVDSVKLSDLLDMEYKDGKLTKTNDSLNQQEENHNENINENEPENTNINLQDAESNNGDDATILDFLNAYIEDDKFLGAIDYDNDKTLSKDEINQFLTKINGYDGDNENLSLEDIFMATKSITDGTFNSNTQSIADGSETGEDSVSSPESTNNTQASSNAQSASHSGGGGGGNYSGSDSTGTQENKESTSALAKMSESELQTELQNANNSLATKQEELAGIVNGTNSEISTKQKEVDDLYQTYLDETTKVSPELAKLIQDITTKEQEITDADLKIVSAENNISVCETAKTNAEANLTNLKTKKDELDAQKSAPNITPEQLASINSKIEKINIEIEAANTAKTQAETDLAAANAAKNQATADKATKESELAALNAQKAELESDVEAKNPAVKTAKDAYENAKKELDSEKTKLAETKLTEIYQAKDYVNEVQNAIATNKTNNQNSEFSTEPQYNKELGEALAKKAEQIAKSMNTIGSCLNGVGYTLRKFFDKKTVLSTLGHAYLADEKLSNDEFLKKYFKKVDVKRDDLKNLPAGCIVVWQRGGPTKGGQKSGHIAITLGGGKEASDHVQKQVVRNCSYSVYYPV